MYGNEIKKDLFITIQLIMLRNIFYNILTCLILKYVSENF